MHHASSCIMHKTETKHKQIMQDALLWTSTYFSSLRDISMAWQGRWPTVPEALRRSIEQSKESTKVAVRLSGGVTMKSRHVRSQSLPRMIWGFEPSMKIPLDQKSLCDCECADKIGNLNTFKLSMLWMVIDDVLSLLCVCECHEAKSFSTPLFFIDIVISLWLHCDLMIFPGSSLQSPCIEVLRRSQKFLRW